MMAWGKSEEQREAEQRQREAAERQAQADLAAQEEAQRQADYLSSPVGRATTAHHRGDTFFQFQTAIGTLVGKPSGFGSSGNAFAHYDNEVVGLLSQIEEIGWSLMDVGHVFVETGATSTNKVLTTGQGTVAQGMVMGIYLFRRVHGR